MTLTNEGLNSLIRSAMASGAVHSMIPAETVQLMHARLDQVLGIEYKATEAHDWDGCLICAVRALTEGRPREWAMSPDLKPGSSVTGVVIRTGTQPTHWGDGKAPYADIWTGGVDRTRIAGHGMSLRNALEGVEAQVGDTITVTFEGVKEFVRKGSNATGPSTYKEFSATIERGHH